MKRKKPKFKRQQSYLKKLDDKWRKPKGKDSKMRKGIRGKGKKVKIGYGSPKAEKEKLPVKVRISTPKELENIDPKTQVVIIASSVGKKKRLEIMKIAEEREIKIVTK
jgi:large subunit ribosomal protein L32e